MSQVCAFPEAKTDAEKYSLQQTAKKGAYVRPATQFHKRVSKDKDAEFPAVAGRYHLYVSLACPWAHRTLVTRALKGLEDAISFSVVDPYLQNFHKDDYMGWHFSEKFPDPLHEDVKLIWDLYKKSVPDYPQRYLSVPLLWDKKTDQIICNESAEIIEMLNSEFNEFAKNPDLDMNPEELRATMTEINNLVYPNINDGVYRCGFAKSQEAYDEAYEALFDAMDKVEDILSKQRYLTGDRLTLSDIRAFTTLLRFDPVYYTHFKCNKKRVVDYPNIYGFVREIYQMPGVAQTVDIEHIKYHYYYSHTEVNHRQIVPKGPDYDLDKPHGRDREY